MKKNLIIGTATGYKYANMKYFFTSLQKINFKGDIVILVSTDVDEETRNILLQQGVILIYVKNMSLHFSKKYAGSRFWKIHRLPHQILFKILNHEKNKINRLSRYVKIFHLISGSRYCYYYDYLLANRGLFSQVMLTDVRDVVFQADPFVETGNGVFLNFYEEEHSIENSFYTSYWLKNAFGEKALRKIKNRMSICSGTTIGSTDRIIDYLEHMITTQAQITAGLTGLGGFDQGVHNYLIYNNYFPGSNTIRNMTAEVATLNNDSTIILNDAAELVNGQGRVLPVVHQFDRHPNLKFKALS